MKYLNSLSVMAALAAGAFLLNGCGGGGGGSAGVDEGALRGYLESEEMQSDLENLAEFAYYAEYVQVAPIAFMGSDKGLFTDNVDKDEAEEYAKVMSRMLSKADEYEAAWARIDSMQALVTETPNSLQKNEVGLMYAFRDFWRSLRGCGKATREKAMAVAGELDKDQLKTLFNGLDQNQKKGETDYLTWWKNFNNGDYDDVSLQIYNRMYYNTETSFADEAEFINKTVANTGAEISKKAAAFEVEILKAILPDASTDFMDNVETVEKVEKLVKNAKDMTAEEIADNAASIFVDGYDDVKKVSEMAGEDVEAISNVTKKVIDKVTAPSKDVSVVTFTDVGGSSLGGTKIAIAIAAKSAKVTIALGENEDGDHQIVLREEGEHLVSFLTELGEKFTQKIDVVAGEIYKLMGEMNEKAIRDSIAAASSASGFTKSSASTDPQSSAGNPFAKSSSSAEVNKDSKSVVGKWVSTKETMAHNITDYDECYAMWGPSEGMEDMSGEECSSHEYDVNYTLGQTVIFYSDGSADHLDANGKADASYDYTFDKSTGTLTYSYGGETYTAFVSADGTTMTMQTVTDIHYGEIIHKIILEKVSGDVEDE
ncbi:MAG: hypothetical protein IJ896_09155 [Fibrobacter sp.]|nr:hypothetical protein [Fibrobacter sp.]